MSGPIKSLPETVPTDPSMQNDQALKETLELIKGSPDLQPLLDPLGREETPPGGIPRGRMPVEQAPKPSDWYSSMVKVLQNRDDFQTMLDEDIPDELHGFVKGFADIGFDPYGDLSGGVPTSRGRGPPGLDVDTIPDILPPSPHARGFFNWFSKNAQPFDDVLEGDGKPMKCIEKDKFQNWGLTVENSPAYTFVARSEIGLCNLIKWAKKANKKVRAAGYRHTWADFYSSDGEVLVMLLPIEYLTSLSKLSPSLQEIQKNSELVGIKAVATDDEKGGALCTVKAGTTNDMFRQWCLENRQHCIPFNVIMVEITLGGSNGPICHGAGFGTKTLSDLVAEFHYIDHNGNPRIISDPRQLTAAAGCFGLLGICTALTLRLDRMSMAVMNPVKAPLVLAIPPPVGYKVPDAISMKGVTPQELEEARQAFVKRCENDDYLEWFWFPFTDKVWVNTWKKENVDNVASISKLEPYPSKASAWWQWLQGWGGEKITSILPLIAWTGKAQAKMMGSMALGALPDLPKESDTIRTLTSEAIHFRRGIQNMRVRDSEWEIPIPGSPDDPKKRDYSLIQRAWWDGITAFYARSDVPMRLALEMRLTGGSDVLLAPQRGNEEFGTISIEVLTIRTTPEEDWQSFVQQIADLWTSYKDSDGKLLNSRPHWAKEWKGLLIHGQPIEEYLKQTSYKKAIPEFREILGEIAKAQETTVDEMRERFGNPLLERLFFK